MIPICLTDPILDQQQSVLQSFDSTFESRDLSVLHVVSGRPEFSSRTGFVGIPKSSTYQHRVEAFSCTSRVYSTTSIYQSPVLHTYRIHSTTSRSSLQTVASTVRTQRASWRLLNGGPRTEPPVGSMELLASSSAPARGTTFCRSFVYKAGLAIVIAFQTSLGSRAGSNKDPKILATVLHTCEDSKTELAAKSANQVSTSISIFPYQYQCQGGRVSSCLGRS